MNFNKVILECVAVREDQYPNNNLKEIALVGRSNVGKSSFINSMTNKKKIARTSSKPGKTRTINFYNINDKFRIVDLPGYGYAKVSKNEKENWANMIENYLLNRVNLADIFLILDIRHKPTYEDKMMYNWIKHFGYGGIVIATKVDKISKGKIDKHIKIIMETLEIFNKRNIYIYSSEKKDGRDRVRDRIFNDIISKNE